MKRLLGMLAILVTLLSGCEQRELCYDHSAHRASVSIEFDWSDAPEADPATMVVYFFPTDNSMYKRFEFKADGSESRNGFSATVNVPVGTYNVVCFNGETENNSEVGDAFPNFHLTTFDTVLLAPLNRSMDAPKPDDTESQPVRSQASALYSYTVPEPVSLKETAVETVVLKPQKKSATVRVSILNIKNMQAGVEFCAVISGLAESWYPSSGMPGGEEVLVPLMLTPDGDSLYGNMEVFGDNAPHDIRHKFRLYTSQKYYYDFDVTDQIHSAADPYNVDIFLSGIVLPENNGMDVSVDEWGQTENINIEM